MQLEFAADHGEAPAQIVAHLSSGGAGAEPIVLGRCGYHPSVVHVDAEGAARLQAALDREV